MCNMKNGHHNLPYTACCAKETTKSNEKITIIFILIKYGRHVVHILSYPPK